MFSDKSDKGPKVPDLSKEAIRKRARDARAAGISVTKSEPHRLDPETAKMIAKDIKELLAFKEEQSKNVNLDLTNQNAISKPVPPQQRGNGMLADVSIQKRARKEHEMRELEKHVRESMKHMPVRYIDKK